MSQAAFWGMSLEQPVQWGSQLSIMPWMTSRDASTSLAWQKTLENCHPEPAEGSPVRLTSRRNGEELTHRYSLRRSLKGC